MVAYAIAKLANDLQQQDGSLDFERMWRTQSISAGLSEALTIAATAVHNVIVDPSATHRNVTAWAMQPACWSRVARLDVDWPASLENELLTSDQVASNRRAAAKDQKVLNGIEAQTAVVSAGPEVWRAIRQWGIDEGLVSPTDVGILDVACAMPSRVPTEEQSLRTIEILKRLREAGCPLAADVV